MFFYNPNIQPREEYDKRLEEFRRLLSFEEYSANLVAHEYDGDTFEVIAAPYMSVPEGGRRCEECFALRLGKTAEFAARDGFDYFTTTLSVSPHKNARLINEIGSRLALEHGAKYLPADFKKRHGYKHSVALSGQYGLYRQTYCGCAPSFEGRH